MNGFSCFVGVDWSGDKQKWQRGLRVAVARPGSCAPALIPGPGREGRWSRETFGDWLAQELRRERMLVGLDFAFGFPDLESEFPGLKLDWAYVDEMCRGDGNYYGGRFFREPQARHAFLVNSPHLRRQSYSPSRLRSTEVAAKRTKGATPQCVFNAIGAAQVGPSSISGMRFLNSLQERCGKDVAIWPFDEADERRSLVVEVFPRFFPLSKGLSPKLSDHETLNRALEAFGSAPFPRAPCSEDEGDALLTAAALRSLSKKPGCFSFPAAARHEGWIFGVPPA